MLVVTGPEAALRAAQQATSSLPIVIVAIDFDPIARGYIAGLAARGNITGLFFQQVELTGKRLEFLKHALPDLRRVAVFWDGFSADQLPVAEAAARGWGCNSSPSSWASRHTITRARSAQRQGACGSGAPLDVPGVLS